MSEYNVKIRDEIEKVCSEDQVLKTFIMELSSLGNIPHYKKMYNELIEKYSDMFGE